MKDRKRISVMFVDRRRRLSGIVYGTSCIAARQEAEDLALCRLNDSGSSKRIYIGVMTDFPAPDFLQQYAADPEDISRIIVCRTAEGPMMPGQVYTVQSIDDIACKDIDGRSFIVITATRHEEKKNGVKAKALAMAKEAIDMLNAFWVLFWAWLLANLVPFLIVLIAIIILICII